MSDKQNLSKKKNIDRIFHFIFTLIPMHVIKLVTGLLPNSSISNYIRGFLYRPFFKRCGSNFQVASGVIFIQPQNIQIGRDVYIAHNSWVGGSGELIIQDEVIIGPMVTIVSGKHSFTNKSARYGDIVHDKTFIGKGSWIASHVTINAGVKIGSGVSIGANSVVTKDIPDNVFVAGVPARIIKQLD